MAQQDTGLGWSANETYLSAGADKIASMSGLTPQNPIPGQPIPEYTTPADLANNGYLYMLQDNIFGYSQNKVACSEGAEVFVFGWTTDNGYRHYRCYISLSPNVSVYEIGVDREGHYGEVTTRKLDQTYGSPYGTYYYRSTWTAADGLTDYYPVFADRDTGMAYFSVVNLDIYKQFPGYAVVCVAKWITTNGTELKSPILISSNTEFVDMTASETGYNVAKFNGLLNGVRFYMAFWDIPGSNTFTTSFPQIDLADRGNMDLEQLFMTIISTSYSHVIIINSPDPYEGEGAGSGEEGGDGEDLEDDEMGISHHAIPAAINTGFCRIYCPSEQQLRNLSNFLWSAQYDLTAVKKLFANPMDSVLGLSAVPLTLSGANQAVYLGGVDTEMSFPMVAYQSYQVPMGAITVEKRWGSYLDYDPYTKFSIYLPFIGFKDLSADDIMGKQIILDYDVDILSGACTARLQAGGNVLYQWSGQCSIQLPVTASNWNQVFQSATSAALSAGLSVATGTAGPVLAGALAAEGVQAIMGKPRIERGGTASGAAGWMGGLTPYLVRVTPEAIIPSDQNKFIGYPAFSSISLGDLTGYNEISSIHLEGIPATGAELEELEAILKGGVIF